MAWWTSKGKGGHRETSLPLLILIESQEETARAPEDGAEEREREGD